MNTAVHRLRELALSDTGFLFDPYTGATFTLNAAGLCVLQGLREGLDRAALCARLRERFDVGAAAPEDDLSDFVHLLIQHGLLPADFSL